MALLAAYNFDEASGSVLDVTGEGHDFALSGSSARTSSGAGHTDKGLTQGTTSNDAGPAVFGQTASRTLMAWVKVTSAPSAGWAWEWHDNTNDTGRWGFLWLSGKMGIRGTNGSGSSQHVGVASAADSQWHHWAGTYDGTTVRFYLDGTLAASAALSSPLATDADVIRTFTSAGSGVTIDDVRIYDEALSQSAISTLMSTPVTGSTAVTGTLSGSGGGAGSLTGKPMVRGTLAGSGGGTGHLSGNKRAHGTLAGSGGGAGNLFGSTESFDEVSGILSGTGAGAGQASGHRVVHAIMWQNAGGTGQMAGRSVAPRWRLLVPQIVESYPLPGTNSALRCSMVREVTVFGDENGLFTSEQGAIPEGGDEYGAIPFATKYIWYGGHVNVTDDPAIRDLWLSAGFEVESYV